MKLGSAILLVCCSALLAQHAPSTRFVYAVSGAPAAGVKVDVSSGEKSTSYTTDSAGRIPVALPVGRVHVTDPQTGTALLEQGIATPTAEVAVGMPIQLTGEVSGFGNDPSHIEIDCGYGERVAVSDYERLHDNLQIRPRAGEDTIHGMALPPIPGQSKRVHPEADGRFRTGWFAAMDSPELLVFGGPESRAAVKTIKLSKGTKPGATVPVGKIVPEFGATLEVNLNLPKTDLPVGLLMGVSAIQAGPGGRQRMAETLSMEHRLDPEVALFLARRREIPLNFHGVTKLAGLPPIDSLKLYFGGPITGTLLERTVKIPAQGVVRIDLSADEVLGTREPRTTLAGVLRFEGGGDPIANATVVYSSFPDKKETKTGPDGRFEIPGLTANRSGVLFIDMPNPGNRPPFDHLTFSKPVPALRTAPATAAAPTPQVFEVPRPPQGGFRMPDPGKDQAALGGEVQLQQEPIKYQFNKCPGYTQDELQYGAKPILTAWGIVNQEWIGPIPIQAAGDVQTNSLAFYQIVFPLLNTEYAVVLEYTPFLYSLQRVKVTEPITELPFATVNNAPLVQIQVIAKNGAKAPANVEVQFPSWSPEPDPWIELTDNAGTVLLKCVTAGNQFGNANLPVFVDDPNSGYFSGDLEITGATLTLKLGNPPTLSARPGKKSK